MSGADAFQGEMRRLLLRELGLDPFALDGNTADRLLAGRLDPADAPPEYAGVAVVLAAAAGPPTPGELAGEAAAAAMFAAMTRPSIDLRWQATERRKAPGSRLAVLAAAPLGMLLVGGVAAAATGMLSEPAQWMVDSVKRAAHHQPARSAGRRQDPGKVRSGGEGRDGAASVGHTGVNPEAYEGRSGPAAPTGPDATGTARGGQSAAHLAGRDGVGGRDGPAAVDDPYGREQPARPGDGVQSRLLRARPGSNARDIDHRQKESGPPGPEGTRR